MSLLIHLVDPLLQVGKQHEAHVGRATFGQHESQAIGAAESWRDADNFAHLDPTVNTPQPTRHAAADAGSEYQQIKLHNAPTYHEPVFSPPGRPDLASPSSGVKQMTLLQQATVPRPKQSSPLQPRQTPMPGRTTKKVHPLYGPASAPRLSSHTQQRKQKQKQGTGFAIRQPATTSTPIVNAVAGKQNATHPEALRQLLAAAQKSDALPESSCHFGNAMFVEVPRRAAAASSRRTGLAALLGGAQPADADAELIEHEPQNPEADFDVHIHVSPRAPAARRQSLLDIMIDGELLLNEPALLNNNTAVNNASTPMPTANRSTRLQQSAQATHTPGMMLQRQFIAKLQDAPAALSSQLARPPAPSASLSARLTSIVQHEKAQRAQLEATGSAGGDMMTVTIVQQQLEGHIVKCRCYRGHNVSDKVFVMFHNKLSKDVGLHVGSSVNVHAPWTHLQLAGSGTPVILCFHVAAC